MSEYIIKFARDFQQFYCNFEEVKSWMVGRYPHNHIINRKLVSLRWPMSIANMRVEDAYYECVSRDDYYRDALQPKPTIALSEYPTQRSRSKHRPLNTDLIAICQMIDDWLNVDVPDGIDLTKSDKKLRELMEIVEGHSGAHLSGVG